MKSRKVSAALARIARETHDSEAFVAHIGAIAERYRREHALATGPRGREVRRALQAFRKHADGVTQWIALAQRRSTSIEYQALAKLSEAMHSAPNQWLAASAGVVAWLQQADAAADSAQAQLADKRSGNARRVAADALRATFERHGLKWSTQVSRRGTGHAVRLLCAIAKAAGDALTPDEARAALVARSHPATSTRAARS